MNATIKIQTNRIYFEQFETPCGEPEISEVKQAWESAIYAKSEIPDLIKLCEKYGELVAEKAVDAGYDAALAKSDEFVKASKEHEND